MPTTPTRSRRAAVLAGLLAAAVGLGVGELVAAVSTTWASPVLAIGDRVVDAVPRPVKDLAIELFGTADKAALLVGILALLAVAAGGLGLLARHRRRAALAGVAAFGVLGAVATLLGGGTPLAAAPSLAAGLAAVGTLARLVPQPQGRGHRDGPAGAGDDPARGASRRGFLRDAGLAGLAAVATGGLGRGIDVARSTAVDRGRSRLVLPPPRSAVDLDLAALQVEPAAPWLTSNADFYRIDTQLGVPRLAREGWTLAVDGLVERPLTLTLDELEDRYEVVERAITMTCVSNVVGGDLVGTATWLGVRLADVLEDAGVDPRADQVVGRAFDDWTGGFPVEAAFDRDALLVVGMNGAPLPAAHGFPLRLVVPGLYGYVSATKWLTSLELTRFDAFDAYWVEREWDARGPVRTQSRIDTPGGFARLVVGDVVPVAGVAWAQTRGIAAVEVQVDDGPWQPAELGAAHSDDTWRQWVLRWDTSGVVPGRHDLRVRATDGTGEVQTAERSDPFPRGASGHHGVAVTLVAP